MTSEERIRKQKELVESMGRFYEKEGLQPIAGRIMGLLTIMDKEHFTFDEIVEELQISKSSASNALKLLEIWDVVEYFTLTGDRKRYFQIRKLDKFTLIDEYKKKLSTYRDFLQSTLDLKANRKSENAMFVHDLLDMLNFFLDRFHELKIDYINRKIN
jgi:DNA-binding transcriptional regulator GbsR (MarR family)